MEASLIGSSQVIPGGINDTSLCTSGRNLAFITCNLKKKKNSNDLNLSNNVVRRERLVWSSESAAGFSVRASASAQTHPAVSASASKNKRIKPINGVELYVGLPLDTVSQCNTINHARAIAAGLKALKLLGVHGVELPIWWGVAENEAVGKFDWTAYLGVAEIVRKLDMNLHVSLGFHACREHKIELPQWVSRIGESNPSIYFADQSGQPYKDCLSLSVDDLPVLDGKTPLEVYGNFFKNFKSAFAPFFGSTITGVSVGLGPDGELRYPSTKNRTQSGAGEFQCYDKHMLGKLKRYAELNGNPLWGLAGPHDALSYDQSPISGGFFAENGGSWATPYGDFFLTWYSSQLAIHGDRILSLAASIFYDVPTALSGRVPFMHSWYNTRSHPSELTAGYYNTVDRNGYDAIAEIFARNSCTMIIPGVELSNNDVPGDNRANPEALIEQITTSCKKHGVEVSVENSPMPGASTGFEQTRKNLIDKNEAVNTFTYQRMGAYFFSPEHFPAFTQFVRSLTQPGRSPDDAPAENEENPGSLSGKNIHMQAAA
ncbi:inactive beta-amylase 9-like [Andrographis paniculata]|uniref:inactive beta-amylase 9-like n=1 Tax=Andrographis paniculata TaxID=175694 RepID=UPI0021E947CC|nr:inactive beta-amylase 9-like [Andrographis paniculata]